MKQILIHYNKNDFLVQAFVLMDLIAFVENDVRETAARVHFGAQNCSKNATRIQKHC